jgi:four helix bundle protein
MIRHFTDLDAWQEAHKLTLLVYKIAEKFPKTEIYGLTSQIKRAVVSIESCIAEGFYRFHYKDRLNFYYDARGSVGEVQSQLIDGKDLGFCNKENFNQAWEQSEKVRIILQGLITSTENLSKK